VSGEIARDLNQEAEAARALVLNLRSIIADDEQATHDAIEGETGLLDAIAGAVNRLNEIDALRAGLSEYIAKLKQRSSRLDNQSALIRTALASAIEATGLKRIDLASATLTVKALPPFVTVISEADIPSAFWKPQDPTLDRRAILAALKDKQDVPGALLSNGGTTVQIRQG